jgi:hypothetical protein
LVVGWIEPPRASRESFTFRRDLSAQALHQRRGPAAPAFFQALLADALRRRHAAQPTTLGLLQRFAAVVGEDSNLIALPADVADTYRGPGSADPRAGQAALQVLGRWERRTGQLLASECVPAVTDDRRRAATAVALPVGALPLADQGFFDTRRWAAYADRFGISRVPAPMAIARGDGWQPLAPWLAPLSAAAFDGAARLGQRQGLPGRWTARQCPAAVAARRRQKLRA